jgi:hypothetical protein
MPNFEWHQNGITLASKFILCNTADMWRKITAVSANFAV